jgi:hypothetical protein
MVDADSGYYYGHKVVKEPLDGYWTNNYYITYGWVN